MRRLFLGLILAGFLLAACGDDTPRPSPTVTIPYDPSQLEKNTGVIYPFAIGTQNPVPATNTYPFSRWITFPAGTQQLSVYEAPGGSTWVGTFVLPSNSFAAVEALRREAESKGLRTVSIASGSGGFSLHGDIEGLIQVQSFDATSQTLFIALTKLPR